MDNHRPRILPAVQQAGRYAVPRNAEAGKSKQCWVMERRRKNDRGREEVLCGTGVSERGKRSGQGGGVGGEE